MRAVFAALAALFACAPIAYAAELRVAPTEQIVLNQANGRGYNDLVVHGIGAASGPGESLEVQGLRVELLENGLVVETRNLAPAELVASTQRLASAPFPEAIGAQVLNPNGLGGLFGRDVSLADGASLAPSSALVATGLYFATTATPDQVRVTLDYRLQHQRRTRSVSATTSVARYQSPIAHNSPVSGVWTQQAVPTLQSHHRLNPSTEFAVDFFRMNESGASTAATRSILRASWLSARP
jgi:hypothetical protein